MQPLIAETTLLYEDPHGERRPLRLHLRSPRELDDGTWACDCHAEGLLESEREIIGEDSFQALCLATRFLRVFLTGLEEHGARFYADMEAEAPLAVSLCFGISSGPVSETPQE